LEPTTSTSLRSRLAHALARGRRFVAEHPFGTALVCWFAAKQALALLPVTLVTGESIKPNFLFACLATSLWIIPWALVLGRRLQLLSVALASLALGFVAHANVLYFRQFSDLLSWASLRYAGQAEAVGDAITGLMHPLDALYWLDGVILFALAFRIPDPIARRQTRLPLRTAAALALSGLALFAAVFLTTRRTKKMHGGHTALASTLGPIGYHLYDGATYVFRSVRRWAPSDETKAAVKQRFVASPIPPGPTPLTGSQRGRSVIFVQLESTQSFPIGMTMAGRPVTPRFDALAKESVVFPRFHSQIGQGTTSDAELLVNCSLYPARTGSVYYDHADKDLRCLPELLREHGYATVAMHGNRPDFWNRALMYPAVGFDRFESIEDFRPGERIGLGLNDRDFFVQAVEKLQRTPEPFYAFLITITNHTPYAFPNLPRELDVGPWEGTMLGDYLQAIRYQDEALGLFVDELRRAGLLDRVVLVLYGDHQGLMHERAPEAASQLGLDPGRGDALFSFERRVPLLLRLPGEPGRAIERPVGQLDLGPTLLDLLGLEPRHRFQMGRSLFAEPARPVVFPNGSALDAELFFQGNDAALGRPGCFDYVSGEAVDRARCDGLKAHAEAELQVARDLYECDLVPWLLQGAP